MSDRWKSEAGRALAEEVVARLLTDRALDDLALDEHDGRVDLRDLPAPAPRRLQRFETQGWFIEQLGDLLEFRDSHLDRLDFTGAQLQSFRFHDSSLSDCRFDGANCRDWRLWGTEVDYCTFANASLHDAAVGTWHDGRRNTWRHVDLSGSDFRVGVARAAVFEDGDFSNAKCDGVTFSQCGFVRCRFAGSLTRVVFDGRELTDRPAPLPLEDVDFSDASFREVEFMGFDLERVALPKDPDVRVVRRARCVARRGLEMIAEDDRVQARILRALFERRLRGPGTDRDAELFNRRDYFAFGGADLVALAEDVIARAERGCES